MKKFYSNQHGFSILEVFVTLAISTIIALAIVMTQQNQLKEAKALGEKLASLDFYRVVSSELSNFQRCNAFFSPTNVIGGAAALTNLDLTSAATTPVVVYFNSIAGVTLGGKVSPESNTVTIKPVNGIELSILSPSKANIVIKFDTALMVRPIRSLSLPLNLKSTGGLGSTTIIGCMGAFSGGYVDVTASRSYGTEFTNTEATPRFVAVTGAITSNISQGYISAIVDGVTIQQVNVSDANWGSGWLANPQTISFIAPPGAIYKVNKNLANISLISWFELN